MRKLLSFKKGQKGFTLIELLIVIAILGILAAVAIPAVTSMVRTGKVGAANAEIASVQTAAMGYYADNDVYPSDSSDLGDLLGGATIKLVDGYVFDVNGVPEPATVAADGAVTYDGDTIYWDAADMQFVKNAP